MRLFRSFVLLATFVSLACMTGCAAIPAVVEDERSMTTYTADTQIEADIKADLLNKNVGKAYDINVYSFRGHVFLVGEADSDYRTFAEKTAHATDGVRKLTTHWFAVGTSNRASDTTIEAAIDTNLLFAKGVASTRVSVDVWGGHVVLLGIMADEGEIARAVREAHGANGVKSVTSYLMTNAYSLQEAGK